MGIETEYGISVPGKPHVNAMLLSAQVVNAYAAEVLAGHRGQPRWSYEDEAPLRDARGFDLSRAEADPSQLTDDDPTMANVILSNGARLYVDHAHPEYSSPEVTNPRDAVLWDCAGELVMRRGAQLAATTPGGYPMRLYKNNTDGKGASYGCHENYLMHRQTPFTRIAAVLLPFFATRQVITGCGRVGIGQDGSRAGFQISSRADFFETEIGLETTVKRPIVNTRDEPHADPERFRRLHVIVGDANLAQTSTFLKLGITSLVLALIEAERHPAGLDLAAAVREMHAVSHDPGLTHLLRLADGRRMTALDVQEAFLGAAVAAFAGTDPDTDHMLAEWDRVLAALRADPLSLAGELDWPAKLNLLQQYRQRDGLAWDHPRLALIDLQYSDVRPDKGIAAQLQRTGRLRTLVPADEVERAVTRAPTDTRAWFRGECLRRFPGQVAAANWDSVVFDLPERQSLQRVATMDPLRGTREHLGDLFDAVDSATDLVRALSRS